LSDEKVGEDGAIESKAIVPCARDITNDALRLLPMTTRGRAHVAREGTHIDRNVGASHVGTIEKLADERGKGKGLDVEGKFKGVRRGIFCGHRSKSRIARGHTELIEDVVNILRLKKSEGEKEARSRTIQQPRSQASGPRFSIAKREAKAVLKDRKNGPLRPTRMQSST